VILLIMYGIAEGLSGLEAWRMSKEQVIVNNVSNWLKNHDVATLRTNIDGSVIITSPEYHIHTIPVSEIAKHYTSLSLMTGKIDQRILLDVLADRLQSRAAFIEFVAGRIVWVGILATILGVILAFWPLLSAGMAVEAIRLKLGGFFSGIAVAFIPTAASFVFKIALDFGTKILLNAAESLIGVVARDTETKILPWIENK
jgi:hypothetical protein